MEVLCVGRDNRGGFIKPVLDGKAEVIGAGLPRLAASGRADAGYVEFDRATRANGAGALVAASVMQLGIAIRPIIHCDALCFCHRSLLLSVACSPRVNK